MFVSAAACQAPLTLRQDVAFIPAVRSKSERSVKWKNLQSAISEVDTASSVT